MRLQPQGLDHCSTKSNREYPLPGFLSGPWKLSVETSLMWGICTEVIFLKNCLCAFVGVGGVYSVWLTSLFEFWTCWGLFNLILEIRFFMEIISMRSIISLLVKTLGIYKDTSLYWGVHPQWQEFWFEILSTMEIYPSVPNTRVKDFGINYECCFVYVNDFIFIGKGECYENLS